MKADEALKTLEVAIDIVEHEAYWSVAKGLREVSDLIRLQDAQIKSLRQTAQNMMEGIVVFRG